MKVPEKERAAAAHPGPVPEANNTTKANKVVAPKKGLPPSKSGIVPTKTIRDLAKADAGKDNLLQDARKKAQDAMQTPSNAVLKNPWQNRMRVDIEWDTRRKSRSDFQATIRSDNGIRRAVVYGTKAGKARSELGSFNDESDRDGLNAEGREQLQKALYVAREIITKKKEYAAVDDSATESGSDISDEEL